MISVLLPRLLPLSILILLGFAAGRYFGVARESVARLAIYIVGPAVFFYGTATAPLEKTGVVSFLLLPFLTLALASIVCLLLYGVGRLWVPRPGLNLMAFAAGNTNAGYFGIPAAIAVFDEEGFAPAVLISIGFVLYENSIGFYVTARGRNTAREALARARRLPALYAAAAGALLNVAGIEILPSVADVLFALRGAYTSLGLMLIGLAFEAATRGRRPRLNGRLLLGTFLGKFALWPVLALMLLAFDARVGSPWLAPEFARGLLFASALPLAANTVAFAQELDTEPDQAALLVILSTLLALAWVPFWVGWTT